MKLQTTLNIIRAAKPCADGWAKLVKSLPADIEGDTPIDFLHILQSNGLRDCFWALRYVLPEQEKQRDREARLALCEFAENELHIFEIEYPDDKRPRECVEVARRFLNGKATYEQLDCSNKAARDAANYADGGLHGCNPARDAAGMASRTAARDVAEACIWEVADVKGIEIFKARFCTQEVSK
jgi:hypothetical protein